jgi:hypothetical protein
MAVEDDPKFPEWAAALDALKLAKDDLFVAKGTGDAALIADARKRLAFALAEFQSISDQIDA